MSISAVGERRAHAGQDGSRRKTAIELRRDRGIVTDAIRRSVLFAAMAVLALWTGDVRAQRLFEDLDLQRFPLEHAPTALCAEDLSGDGMIDVAVVHTDSGKVSVLLNVRADAAGGLGVATVYETQLGPVFVTTGDVNGDGFPDLVVVNSGSSTISVLLNGGEGRFLEQNAFPVPRNPRAARVVDIDRDGHPDIISVSVVANSAGVFSILAGDGGGFVEVGRFDVGDNPHWIEVADFDGDGIEDVAVAHTQTVSWFRGQADFTFESAVKITSTEYGNPRFMGSGDFNSDGREDLVVYGDTGALSVLEWTGVAEFSVRVIARLARANVRAGGFVSVGDLDGDGHLDVFTRSARELDLGLSVLRGSGDGTFSALEEVYLDAVPAGMDVGDVDGDGVSDLIIARPTPDEVDVVRSLAPGRLQFLSRIELEEPPAEVASADVDRDATPDLVWRGLRGVFTMLADGQGGFHRPVALQVEGTFLRLAALNLDGAPGDEIALLDPVAEHVLIAFLDASGRVDRTVERPVGDLPWRLAVADLDGDGREDLAVASQASTAARILYGAGGPDGPEPVEIDLGRGQSAITAGDVDGDGHADLAAATTDGLRFALGNAGRIFPRLLTRPLIAGVRELRLADVDGDGVTDVVALGPADDGVLVLYSAGREDSPRSQTINAGFTLESVEARDVNGDGRAEILTTSSRPFSALLVNRAGGGHVLEQVDTYIVGARPVGLVLADLDGDGLLEGVTANSRSSNLTILPGDPGQRDGSPLFRRGDVDGDARVGLTDAVMILGRLFGGAAALACEDAADADDDGVLNLTDAVVILTYLFGSGTPPAAPGPGECGFDPGEDELAICRGGCG